MMTVISDDSRAEFRQFVSKVNRQTEERMAKTFGLTDKAEGKAKQIVAEWEDACVLTC